MSAGTLGNNLLNSLTGQVEKAYIDITDKRDKEVVIENVKKANNSLSGLGSLKGINTDSMGITGLTDKVLKGLSTNTKRYIVQFNPSTLNIQAMGGGRFAVTNHSDEKGESKLDYAALTPRIQVSVKLIFDEVQRPALQSKDDSVRTQVEAFIAALRNPQTRNITFAWGTLCYSGNLISVDSRYTMFSLYGKPLRAEVTLTLVCMDENLKKENMGMWEERYRKAFQGDSTDLTSFGQKIGNLVKINL